MSRAKM